MKLSSEKKILINTSIQRIWDILTDSKYTKQYMFNCSVSSDWIIGSSITWQGNYQGYEAFQKGVILNIIPNELIQYSTFDPNFGLEDVPDNYIHVSYIIEPKDEHIQLTIKNETFDGNKERMEHINSSWEMVMTSIKQLSENK